MPLLTFADAELAYGDVPLLDGADLALEQGERIGLIGRNGTGKSSLLGVIAGSVQLDHGVLKRQDGLRIAIVPQEPQLLERETVREALLAQAQVAAHRLEAFLHRLEVDPQAKVATRYRLTTHRLFKESGILSRAMNEIELVRVDDVAVRQNIIQRIFNVGVVTVIAPHDQTEPRLELVGIENPIEVKEMIRTHVRLRRKGSLNVENI